MASTFTSRIRLEKQADGENANAWGLILNQNVIDLVDEAIAGMVTVTCSSAEVTLSTANGGSDQSRNAAIRLIGTLTANVTVALPAAPEVGDTVTIIDSRNYFASNKCTVDRNGKPINNGTSNVDLTTNAMAATFIYVDSTCGWNYLSKAT